MSKVLVVGGGAAGMMAAISAAEQGAEVVVLEKNRYLGRKLGITGKGRCNVTNDSDIETLMKNIARNSRFMYSSLSAFDARDVMAFFEELGVPLKTERGQRVFPVSDKAGDVVRALDKRLKELKVRIERGEAHSLIIEDGCCCGVRSGSKEYRADGVIVATGGKSYPVTGSDGAGYILAKQAGHSVVTPVPSLSALETKQRWVSKAAGLTLKNISMCLYNGEKRVYEDFGELMFADYGISGPTVLSASAHIDGIERGSYSIVIDLKPALSEKQLDARILRDFGERHGMKFGESLRGLLPAQLTSVVVEETGIDPEKRVDEVSKAERQRLLSVLKGLRLDITAFRPIAEAIVTRGGVSVKEISPKTMESKLCSGLYFAGEVIDVDAYTGGFNLQIAFSTGRAAGIAAAWR